MKISFFQDWSYVTWVDYSHREDCIHVADMEIPEWAKPVLSKKWKKCSVSFIDIPQPQEPETLPESNQ